MAIFRAETKHITRGKNHNVVAAAAYRSGEKLTDTNRLNPDVKVHDYSKKRGVMATGIILPDALVAENFTIGREALWSGVEQFETTTRSVKGSRLKKKARLAREWLLALPHELSRKENEALTREFTTRVVNELGVIADYAIHRPTADDIKPKWIDGKKVKGNLPDSRNIHAHILFTTRQAVVKGGQLTFGRKADSEQSEKWRQEQGMVNGGDYLKEVREMWAELVNQRLAQKNILPVSAKSYKDLGINLIPQHKQGKNASVMARYHFTPPIIGLNDVIKERNDAYLESAAAWAVDEDARYAADSVRAAGKWLSARDRVPFDGESGVKRVNEQTDEFNRLTERALAIPSEPPRVLISQAVRQYERVMKEHFSKYLKSEADPHLLFNERQFDTIRHIYDHIRGDKSEKSYGMTFDTNRQPYKYVHIEPYLVKPVNKHLLMLLTDPVKEQRLYEEDEQLVKKRMNAEREALPPVVKALDIESEDDSQSLEVVDCNELEADTLDKPEPTLTPSFKPKVEPKPKPPRPRFR